MRADIGVCCILLIAASPVGAAADTVLESPYRSSCFEPYRASDYVTAAKACLAAAESGDVESQLIVAWIYTLSDSYFAGEDSDGPSNYTEAMKWYRRAADQGNARGQFEVGQLYADGHGVAQDYGQAAKWYQLAADQGDVGAQLYLGVLYEYGRGVAKDYVQAYKWYALAAQKVILKNPKAPAVKNRDYLAGQMTAAQLSEARKLVADWHAQ